MLGLPLDTTTQRVSALVVSIATQHDVEIRLSPTESLVDSGLSSVAMVDLMLAVEREFDLTIPDREIDPSNFFSVATLAALVDRCGTAAKANQSGTAERSHARTHRLACSSSKLP